MPRLLPPPDPYLCNPPRSAIANGGGWGGNRAGANSNAISAFGPANANSVAIAGKK
jgi:hypothetical protein